MNSQSCVNKTTKKVPRKKLRKASEKRKEKCREAARHRRSQEVKMFTEMANLLPLPNSLTSQLNQGSMRLTIAFLKVKSLLDNSVHELFSILNLEEKCSIIDPCWSQALGGILLALSSEGEIIYLTENVINQLGLPQIDFIGKNIFDYCHTDDHNELRQVLALRPDGELARSFILRFKSIFTAKGTINCDPNYKVMNCLGRIVTMPSSNVEVDCSLENIFSETNEPSEMPLDLPNNSPSSHFLVMVSDPIPRPSHMKMSFDSQTFITNNTLDMKFTYVDEKINQFLGFTPYDLKGQSMYQFHHAEDSEHIMKSYKTMLHKGQTQTQPYRFLAKYGGYVWVQTQATLISVRGCNEIEKSQAVVCVHTVLSEIEESDQILSVSQVEASVAGPV